ncbi:MAG: CRISPR-associated CARF protein Csa3 [Candidatus Methanomethyliaceae archaeon]
MILIFTLGFDEKFTLRGILRDGVSQNDAIYLLSADFDDPRVEKAFISLKEIVNKAFPGLKIEKVQVQLEDFSGSVLRLRRLFRDLTGHRIILNLSGGQRILSLILMTSVLSLNLDVDIEIETEDSKILFRFPSRMMKPIMLDELDRRILELIGKEHSIKLRSISEILGISKPSVWRRLEGLIEKGLVIKNEKRTYSLTELGMIRSN